MKSNICALNTDLADAKKILVDNQPLDSAGDKLSKLKSINKQPQFLAAYIFYAMVQAVIPKALPGGYLSWRWIDSRWSLGKS